MVAILMFVGSALLHHVMLADAVRARMSAGEPFGIIAYGVFALVVLGFKQRGYALRGELEHARSEKVALERVARVSMALRDLANTPVQTLELVRQRLLTDDPQLRHPDRTDGTRAGTAPAPQRHPRALSERGRLGRRRDHRRARASRAPRRGLSASPSRRQI